MICYFVNGGTALFCKMTFRFTEWIKIYKTYYCVHLHQIFNCATHVSLCYTSLNSVVPNQSCKFPMCSDYCCSDGSSPDLIQPDPCNLETMWQVKIALIRDVLFSALCYNQSNNLMHRFSFEKYFTCVFFYNLYTICIEVQSGRNIIWYMIYKCYSYKK